jgi:hypothetical protein
MKASLEHRLSALESRVRPDNTHMSLQEELKMYEEIFTALDQGDPLDLEDPLVKDVLEYQDYFNSLEGCHEEH